MDKLHKKLDKKRKLAERDERGKLGELNEHDEYHIRMEEKTKEFNREKARLDKEKADAKKRAKQILKSKDDTAWISQVASSLNGDTSARFSKSELAADLVQAPVGLVSSEELQKQREEYEKNKEEQRKKEEEALRKEEEKKGKQKEQKQKQQMKKLSFYDEEEEG